MFNYHISIWAIHPATDEPTYIGFNTSNRTTALEYIKANYSVTVSLWYSIAF
jgi:hypothetical protein